MFKNKFKNICVSLNVLPFIISIKMIKYVFTCKFIQSIIHCLHSEYYHLWTMSRWRQKPVNWIYLIIVLFVSRFILSGFGTHDPSGSCFM